MTQRGSDVLGLLATQRLLPVVVLDDPAAAEPLGEAIRQGGLSLVEITLRTPGAITAISSLTRKGELLVGAGTVLDRRAAELAVEAGASFIVSPGLSPAVVSYCAEVGVPALPGVATATDISNALALGCDVVKFFPADINGGLPAINALAAPFGDVQFVPTGGITAQNAATYLAHPSVLAVGGSWMVARSLIASKDWDTITALVATAVGIAETAKDQGSS